MVVLTETARDVRYLLEGDYDRETFALNDFPFFVFHTVSESRQMLERGGVQILHEVASDRASELLEEKINGMDEETYAQYLRYHFYICENPNISACPTTCFLWEENEVGKMYRKSALCEGTGRFCGWDQMLR